MTKWLIHIGVQKTGSKALQLHLAGLNSPSLFFATTGREGNWHEPLYEALQAGDRFVLERLADEQSARGDALGIISYEGFYDLPPEKVSLLASVAAPAKVVLFMRRQDQLLNSLLIQFIKAHRVSIDAIRELESEMTEYLPLYDYRINIEKWVAAFGEQNVLPIIYTKDRHIVDCFFGALDLSVPGVPLCENPNPALNWRALSILRHVKQLARNVEDVPALVEATRGMLTDSIVDTAATDYYVLAPSVRRRIVDAYADGNEWVRKAYYQRRSSLFAPLDTRDSLPVDWSYGEPIARKIVDRFLGLQNSK